MGTQLPKKEAQQPPNFWHMSIVVEQSPISATAELLLHLWTERRLMWRWHADWPITVGSIGQIMVSVSPVPSVRIERTVCPSAAVHATRSRRSVLITVVRSHTVWGVHAAEGQTTAGKRILMMSDGIGV